MLPQGKRRWWYDGYQAAMAFPAIGGAIAYLLTHGVPKKEYLFAVHPEMLLWAAVPGIIGALLWAPIAWWTWRPYVITPPGLGDGDD